MVLWLHERRSIVQQHAVLSNVNSQFIADATKYSAVINSFNDAIQLFSLDIPLLQDFPVTWTALQIFLLHAVVFRQGRSDSPGCSLVSCRKWVSGGIRHVHTRIYNQPWILDDKINREKFNDFMTALARGAHAPTFQIVPLTLEKFYNLWDLQDNISFLSLQTFITILATQHGLEGFLRANEYVSTPLQAHGDRPHFLWQHLVAGDTPMSFQRVIPRAKTARGFQNQIAHMKARPADVRCHFKGLAKWKRQQNDWAIKLLGRPLRQSDPVFIECRDNIPIIRNESFVPLSSQLHTLRLRQWAASLGCTEQFSANSVRSGMATSAFRAGIDLQIIKRLGRWQSDSVLLYIRILASDIHNARSILFQARRSAAAHGLTQ